MGGFTHSELAARLAEQAALAGGGVEHHTDGLLGQQADQAFALGSGFVDITYVAVLPDSDGNITYSAPTFTVVNSGLYSVNVYGNWEVDNSVEVDERIIRFKQVNVQSPAAQGVYAWAADRTVHNIVPPATVNLTTGNLYFNLGFTTMFEAGDQFKLQGNNTDGVTATNLESLIISIVKLA